MSRAGAGALAGAAAIVALAANVVGALPVRAIIPPGPLVGTFKVTAGSCSPLPGSAPSGSYFFMQPGSLGSPVSNLSSPCVGGNYTPVTPGSEGGITTGRYQLDPVPTFSGGNSLADRIIKPVSFFNASFGLASTCADQQNAPTTDGSCPAKPDPQFPDYPAPSLSYQPCSTSAGSILSGGLGVPGFCLFGDLRALGATWNGLGGDCTQTHGIGCYDQGVAVDAGGTVSCDTGASGCSMSGTFDPTSNAFTLSYRTPIHGGAFNGFVGNWHLEGTFTPQVTASAGSPSSGTPASTAPTPGGTPPAAAGSAAALPSGPPTLTGVLGLSGGQCGSGTPSGSYFAMSKGGGPIKNSSANCGDGTYTLLTQGTTGLKLGSFQPTPSPGFDGSGNGLAADIIRPVPFFGTNFALSTNAQDEQAAPSGPAKFAPPSAILEGSTLTANLGAVTATWNGTPNGSCTSGTAGGNGCYDQGSSNAKGTFDPQTRHYTLEWSATIVGGAFNGATGTWHFEGTFAGQIVQHTTGAVAPLTAGVPGFSATGAPPAVRPSGLSLTAALAVAGGTLACIAGLTSFLVRRIRRGKRA